MNAIQDPPIFAHDKETYRIREGDYVTHERKLYRVTRIFTVPHIQPPSSNTMLELMRVKDTSITTMRDRAVEVLE